MNAIARFLLLLSLFACTLLAPDATAQKSASKYRKFPAIGVEFKPLKDFSDVPVDERMASRGIVGQFEAARGPHVKFSDGYRGEVKPSLKVLYIKLEGPSSGSKSDEDDRDERRDAKDFVKSLFRGGLRDDKLEAELSDVKWGRKMVGERAKFISRMRYSLSNGSSQNLETVFDVYTFPIAKGKVIFVWDYPADGKVGKKWGKAVLKSMKSFRYTKKDAEEVDIKNVNSESSYADLLAFHRHEVEQTPGWQLIETPSKQYLIKTNEDDKKDIKEVIARLEASRKLYEKDFPPTKAITSVSVVRICASRSEFNTYGQTGGGVAGYFNPRSEELVLFFGDGGKASTLAVMAHEGFHQYCHFLFDRAEAHRWFDEGHGDYYGAWKLKGKKLIQQKDMKGGLARIPEIKEMFRNKEIKPLSEHIRADHRTWQTQGPSNVSCYAQSFALVYFLREGADGNVKKKYWKKEYATILPNYMRELNKGFQAVYDEIRKEGQEVLDRLDKMDPEDVDETQRERAQQRVDSPWDFARGEKEEVWDAAMKASWGQIDEAEFEKRWLEYIEDVL